jgi:hypothetical protein
MIFNYLLFLLTAACSLSCHASYIGDCASTIGDIECSIGEFSLLLFSLEKNTLHIERYKLDELAHDINIVSSKDSASHCLYKLNLGERGQRISCIDWAPNNSAQLVVTSQRAKVVINYLLNWAMLVIKEDEIIQDYMKAPITIKKVDTDLLKKPATKWASALAITWGIEGHSLDINLVIDRKIESASCAIVPNNILEELGVTCLDMKKSDLINAGIMAIAPQDIILTKTVQALCLEEQDKENDQEQPSWFNTLYNSVAAKIAILKEYVFSCCDYC